MPETHYARSGDVSIAYQVIGDGERDLIFVPGIVSHLEFFHELPGYTEFLNGLASFARVIVIDKRGNGLSDRIIGAATLEDRMDDIPAVMDAVGSERAVLFAVSEGGPISLMFAATYPERVEALVLYETFARLGLFNQDSEEALARWRKFLEQVYESYGTGWSLPILAGRSLASDPHLVELWGQAERMSNSPSGFRAIYEAQQDFDISPMLPTVRAPSLLIHGAENEPAAKQNKYLASNLPDARLVSLEGVAHYPWFVKGDQIVAEVEEFVTGSRTPITSERMLSTLLFTDIVGSTDRAAAVGDRQWRAVLESYYRLVRRQTERFRGIEVSTEGDGFFARFDGPARAVSCADAIRDGVHGLGLQIRAGLHTGEIVFIEDDVTGLAVHIAARVAGLAGDDEVLVSRTVKDLVVGSGLDFVDRGTSELKGIPDTWQLYALRD